MDLFFLSVRYVFVVAIGLLPIMNPLSTIPLFLALTRRMEPERQRRQAARASIYAFAILAAFLLVGNGIIALFGISMPGIRVAGGLTILVLAFRMLFAGETPAKTQGDEEGFEQHEADYSFSPLAMPSLAGPGSIAVVMSYGSEIPEKYEVLGHFVVLCGIGIVVACAYVALAGAVRIAKFLGEAGIQSVTKIMGFLLACVAVQFIASGIRDFIISFS